MKKLLAILFICITAFGLTACGEKLTLDNYYEYIDIQSTIKKDEIYDNHCLGADGILIVKGLSSLYDYSNIDLVVTVTIETAYDSDINKEKVKNNKYSIDVPVGLIANGDGVAEYRIDFQSYFDVTNNDTMSHLAKEKPGQYSIYYPLFVDASCEVKSIKGRLKK